MPKKKNEDNIISLAKKANDASKYTTKELIKEISNSDIPEEYKKCFCIVCNQERKGGGSTHKFNYFIAGFKSRIELLGVLEYIKSVILEELNS